MFNWLKKYFIPHEANDHKPHILRWETALIIVAGVVVLESLFLGLVYVASPQSGFFASILSSVLVDSTNINRTEFNLTTLHQSNILTEAAKLKAEDMAAKGYFAHTSPEGVTPWYWLDKVGYNFAYAGENLAVNFTDSQDAMSAWMNSPSHRANILNRKFTEIGIATAQGIYQGKETTYIVQFFGSPAVQPSVAVDKSVIATAQPVKPVAEEPVVTTTTESFAMVRGASVAETDNSAPEKPVSFLTRIASSPRNMLNFIYIVVGTIILLGLLLTIFIKIRIQHPPLIVTGVLLIILIASVITLNQYLILAHSRVL